VCKKCNVFLELAEFTGKEWDRKAVARIKPAAASASLNMIEPAGGVESRRSKFRRVKEK
jgi:hypothetical protein